MGSADAFGVLASADRQYLLDELVERDGERTIDDLSRRVAARRHRTDSEDVSAAEIDRARTRLVHIHHPRLRERDLVERRDGTVTLAENGALEQVLAAAAELDDCPVKPSLTQQP